MNNLKIFENAEFGQIRTVVIDGEPWFVGKDVAGALAYKDEFGALKKHILDEDKLLCQIDSAGQKREVTVINESGLYALIFGSKLDSARKFKHWVTAEVLPSIRKTEKYEMENTIHQKVYETKATSLGEVASYTKEMDRRMEKQGTEPWKICEAFKMVSEQFGIVLPADFVKTPKYEQMNLFDMEEK